MDFYLDTEFYVRTGVTQLISLAVRAREGAKFYVENRSFNWALSEADKDINMTWLTENVKPHLWQPIDGHSSQKPPKRDWDPGSGVRGGYWDYHQISNMLSEWIVAISKLDGKPTRIFTWYGATDWVLFTTLLGGDAAFRDFPEEIPKFDHDLKQMAYERGVTSESLDALVHREIDSSHPPLKDHNALDDTFWNYNAHLILENTGA